jgi:tRNA threonylcarbamoyladenosine biosynthesis protein TsaB
MSSNYILCIDASVQTASVALADGEQLLAVQICEQQREHAAFIQPAIEQILEQLNLKPNQLNAVAVTAGPGSYTGLRVGMASAKGLCYALQIPLITLGTLDVMADAAKKQIADGSYLLCPMIDARRMEVFTAVYNEELNTAKEPHALILYENSFAEFDQQPIYFFGNGAAKWQTICKLPNAKFIEMKWNAASMIQMAFEKFKEKQFASLAYAVPFYLKDFHNTSKV